MCYIIFFNFIQQQCKTANASYIDIHNVFNLNIVFWGNTAVAFISYNLNK